MNLGARNSESKMYNFEQMSKDLTNNLDNTNIQNMILNDCSSAFNWIEQRGNSGDNIPIEAFEQFHKAILEKDAKKALQFGVDVLETQKHPTARDIVDSPVKQFVYNCCGYRTYTYEIED